MSESPSGQGSWAPKLGFRPGLEGLRGFAVVIVVLFHAQWLAGGALGVDLFLVLSGFLITTLLLEEWRTTGGLSLRDFFIRRGLRLYPALALYLLAFVALNLILRYADTAAQLKSAAWSALYLANVPLAYDPQPWFATELTHLWTLAAEAQFYLVWPPVLWLLLRRGVRFRSIAIGLLCVIVAVAVWRGAAFFMGGRWQYSYYGPEMRFDTILVGCLLAIAYARRWVTRVPAWVVAVAALGFAAVVIVSGIADHGFLFFGGLSITAVLAALLVLAAVHDGFLTRALSFPVLQEFGRVSYSWYLWHVRWIAMVNFSLGPQADLAKLGAIIASFVTAEASYRLVEVRFLRMKGRFTRGRATVDPLA